jgi:ribosomal protein S12 methylthiotransferase
MSTGKKVSIVTLGCAKNTADTENLARLLRARGHEVVADAAGADAIVVHTCSFIEAAKKESIDTILQAGQLKTEGKKLFVTGCLVQQHGDQIFNELPEVDAFLGTGQLAQVADLLTSPRARFIDRANPGGYMDPDEPIKREAKGASAYLRLSEGCSHPCTFCVIPRLRGPVQSRSAETIMAEANDLARLGVQEFSIIGQDTGDWGRDRQGNSQLPDLLNRIGTVPGIRWVRLMYLHPASMTDNLLNVFSDNPDRFPYLDMPFQHIDSQMLETMKRKGDEAKLRALIEKLHRRAPDLSLRTTFIVGFPGETDEQFERLLDFVKEGHFDYLGAFSYSQEEGTPAAVRADQIPDDVKRDRLAAITDAHFMVAQKKAEARLGQIEEILLEETEGETILGRTRREAPEIDAVVRMPRAAARQGRFVKGRLSAYDAYEFVAEPAKI